MAVRRVKNQPELPRLRAAHVARVRRTVKKVEKGKVEISEVEKDIRAEVARLIRRREGGEEP